MNELIISRYNSLVKPEDTVYILGDLALGGGDLDILVKNKMLIE